MIHQHKDGRIDWLNTGMFLFMIAILILGANEWSKQQTEQLKRSNNVIIIVPKEEDMKAWSDFMDRFREPTDLGEKHVGTTNNSTHE